MRILLVEDETYIAEALASVLKKNHYSVDLAFDGENGLDSALSEIYDIIILDIMLPKMDGISLLRELRRNKSNVPVLLLTARDQTSDKVQGLDSGADDYLAKPFQIEELLARLRALGRRKSEHIPQGILQFGNTGFDPLALSLSCNGEDTKLSLKESQILELLMKGNLRILSKERIIEKLWGYDTDGSDNNVETHVSLLRKKLKQVNSDLSIRTVRGVGYLLEEKKE